MLNPTSLAYKQLRGSVKFSYIPIYSNPFGYIRDNRIASLFKDKLRPLSLIEFSKLCHYCHTNNDIKNVILLLTEAQTQSLVSSPGILSIALETLSNIIYKENEPNLSPIKSKSVAKKVRKEIIKVINTFDKEIDDEGRAILIAKIDQINQTTNRDKLLSPFKILNIPLSKTDIAAIDQRNAFLHGRTPMFQSSTENKDGRFRYYLFFKLYVLVCSVILKYVGFDNSLVNFPKIYEKTTGILIDEDYYREI